MLRQEETVKSIAILNYSLSHPLCRESAFFPGREQPLVVVVVYIFADESSVGRQRERRPGTDALARDGWLELLDFPVAPRWKGQLRTDVNPLRRMYSSKYRAMN